MGATKDELVGLSDYVWGRLRARLEGLGDDEYLWEPAPGCWTVRRRPDGQWKADWPLPTPEPAPFTTIAWRLWHLIDMYGEDRAPTFLDVEPQGRPIGFDDPDCRPPAHAEAAIEMLERAHDRWDRHLAAVPEERLGEAVGTVGGQYAEESRASYVLHMLDEFIHHGAEVGVLRDLWRWQREAVSEDPIEERVIRGDLTVLDDLDGDSTPAAARGDVDLVLRAASYGRWELVEGLVRQGFPAGNRGRTALHMAAGAGELDTVKMLLDHGADPSVRDPEFGATPLQWAQFLQRPAVVAWLEANTSGDEPR